MNILIPDVRAAERIARSVLVCVLVYLSLLVALPLADKRPAAI